VGAFDLFETAAPKALANLSLTHKCGGVGAADSSAFFHVDIL
jgi:hypothetical protein